MSDENESREALRYRVFKLDPGGKAYQAATALRAAVETAIAEKPFGKRDSYTLKEAQDYWQSLYRNLYKKLETENRDLLEATGLLAPATQVTSYADGYPRAYKDYPVIFINYYQTRPQSFLPPEEHTELYMYAPVDYRGESFTPEGAVLLDPQEEERVGRILFAGGWIDPIPVFAMTRHGVPVPADFDPQKHQAFKGTYFEEQVNVCFVAQGRSLDLIEDFQHREQEWRQACNAVMDEVRRIIEADLGGEIKQNLPFGEEFYVNFSYTVSPGERPDFTVSVRKAGKVNIMEGGQPVKIPANPYFKPVMKSGAEYLVVPKNTPEGQKLQALIDTVPLTPSLADYPELRGHFPVNAAIPFLSGAGIVPRIQEFDGKTLLIYMADKNHNSDFCPPDATPLSGALYTWLNQDQGDRNMGIVPPPMPEALKTEYGAYRKNSLSDITRRFEEPG